MRCATAATSCSTSTGRAPGSSSRTSASISSRSSCLPPSMAELERRLRERGTDSEEVIADRMRRAADEISHWAEYEYVLVNDDMDDCLARVRAIVAAERLEARAPDRSRPASSADLDRSRALGVEQLQESRRGEEVAAPVLDRRFGLGVRAPLLDLPALVDADRVPRLVGGASPSRAPPARRPASRRSSPAATGRRGGTASSAATAWLSRSTVAGGWATCTIPRSWRNRRRSAAAPSRAARPSSSPAARQRASGRSAR